MFRITGKKGFHITFENGYTVSVQFGPGNYCDHDDRRVGYDDLDKVLGPEMCGVKGSTTAECAVFADDNELLEHSLFDVGDTVGRYLTPVQVLELMIWAAAQ